MQYLILGTMLVLTLRSCRGILRARRAGMEEEALRRFRRAAWGLGGTILASMAAQELILLCAGMLTWQTGLPLHLCSLMGLLALPALLTRRPLLLHAALFAGVPGAALALLFPAMLATPWPRLTALAFHGLHAGLVCVPLLPMAMGWQPRPLGALSAWSFMLLAGAGASLANRMTGGNYLFLAGPAAGTPLMWLAGGGPGRYRLGLLALASLVLAAEGVGLRLQRRLCTAAGFRR